MPDMLVKLYDVKPCDDLINSLKNEGIEIKRAMGPDITLIKESIISMFSQGWADEAFKAMMNSPSSCYIATKDKKVIGFACYDTTAKGFFGPTGVDERFRGKGIGKALLIKCLLTMYELGYGYAIIGAAGPVKFYEKNCGAVVIPDCMPGVYEQLVDNSWTLL